MAIVVLEEMLGGLDEVKGALDQAIIVLTDLIEDCDPAMVPHLVWSNYSNSPSHRRLRPYHRARSGLSSAPLSPILSVKRDGKG